MPPISTSRTPLRTIGWRTLAVAAALALAAPSGASAATGEPPQGPSGDEFYQPPAPLPDGVNGDVIWWRELPQQLGTKAYLVLYRSESATGQPIAVTGRVLVPTAEWDGPGDRPIVSTGSGTRGIGDECAPSKFQPDYERPLVEPMLRHGWAVAITDYEGLGTPGPHPYVVGKSEGRTVIDAARAATRLPEAALSEDAPVAFSGYSQGGGAAAWAGELAPDYAPDMDVVGVAAGGNPADLLAVSSALDGGVGFGFEMLTAFGFNAAYPELDLMSFLNDKGKETFEKEQNACVDAVFGHAFEKMADYTTHSPLEDPRWQARLEENSLGSRPQQAPIYLFHGTDDEILPRDQAEELRDQYCAAGSEVTWRTFPGEHVSTLITGAGSAVDYLAERFNGDAPESDC